MKYASGEEVSLADDGCYENLVNVQIDSMKNDAWSGSIKASVDNNPFVPMTCINGCLGDSVGDRDTDNIVIDGASSNPNVGEIDAEFMCLPGVVLDEVRVGPCTLQVAVVEEENDTPVVSFCCLRR